MVAGFQQYGNTGVRGGADGGRRAATKHSQCVIAGSTSSAGSLPSDRRNPSAADSPVKAYQPPTNRGDTRWGLGRTSPSFAGNGCTHSGTWAILAGVVGAELIGSPWVKRVMTNPSAGRRYVQQGQLVIFLELATPLIVAAGETCALSVRVVECAM